MAGMKRKISFIQHEEAEGGSLRELRLMPFIVVFSGRCFMTYASLSNMEITKYYPCHSPLPPALSRQGRGRGERILFFGVTLGYFLSVFMMPEEKRGPGNFFCPAPRLNRVVLTCVDLRIETLRHKIPDRTELKGISDGSPPQPTP